MSVPAAPGAHLVISKSDLSLGVMKSVFDPETLALYAHQLRELGFSRSVADDVVDFCGVADFADGEDGPGPGMRFLMIPEPHALTDGLDPELPFGRVPDCNVLPGMSCLIRCPRCDGGGNNGTSKRLEWQRWRWRQPKQQESGKGKRGNGN